MADRKLYGWKDDDGKYLLSRLPPDAPHRPANKYDTMAEAMKEAGQRGLKIEWADGVID